MTASRRPVPPPNSPTVVVGSRPVTIEQLVAVSKGTSRIELDPDPGYRNHLAAGVAGLAELLRSGRHIYGVTTGFGASHTNHISSEFVALLPANLVRFHGCGTGDPLGEVETAAVLVARLTCLARGYSAVRPLVLERVCALLNRGVLPVMPSEGSVGASGDLTPLSYLAATLLGEREVHFRGTVHGAEQALAELGMEPLALAPKESLALMNGTSAMAGLGCLAHYRATRLARLACATTALMVEALKGNRSHFDPRLFDLKPHPGQVQAASWIREDLGVDAPGGGANGPVRQDQYSIRCAPHVVGVLSDALTFARGLLETELNSVNDNPIILPEPAEALHGGNFYGGHVAFAMDALKIAVASVADLLDRQVALICNPATNNGLPGDLVAATDTGALVHHGFKAMQITASALAAEALKGAMPATLFSRSTESHNQDKVSMGTIAARDCLRILDLTETVAAIALLAACQGRELRGSPQTIGNAQAVYEAIRRRVGPNHADRRQDLDIAEVLEMHRTDMLLPDKRL